jgi:hypothetical protein
VAPPSRTALNAARGASDALTRALVGMAARGERPRCADPVDHARWTSAEQSDRAIAAAWCRGCPILRECLEAATARHERWHVWGGVDMTRKPETVTMTSLRCWVFGHLWGYATMPGDPRVVSRACARCGKFEIKLAEPLPAQLQRLDDNAKIKPLFHRRGWPK